MGTAFPSLSSYKEKDLSSKFPFSLVVIGDGNGQVGHGLGKAREVSAAIQKATKDAEKNLVRVPVLKGTIPHEQHGKYGAGKVLIRPAADGTGVIAGGAMRAVLEMAGVHNVLAKSLGSSNPHNVIKATIDALSKLRSPMTVAKQRGVELESDLPQKIIDSNAAFADLKTSMLQDVEKGRSLEYEALNGVIRRFGREAGIATPVNDTLYGLASCLDSVLRG